MRMASSGSKVVRLGVLAAVVALLALVGSLLAAPVARASTNCNITQNFSVRGDKAVNISFVNGNFQNVDLYWLNYNPPNLPGTHYVYYNTVGAAIDTPNTVVQPTFETHPWVALDPTYLTCFGYTIGGATDSVYPIPGPPFAVQGSPTIASIVDPGVVDPGKPVSVNTGAYATQNLTYTYTWDRCSTPDWKTCIPISGATDSTYTPGAADDGQFIRANETAVEGLGLDETTPTPVVPVGTAALTSAISCVAPCQAYPGATVTFTGTVTDAGPNGAAPPHVGLSLTPGGTGAAGLDATIESATLQGGSCSIDGNASCDADNVLAANASLSFTMKVKINVVGEGPATLRADVSPSSDTPTPVGIENTIAQTTIDVADVVPVASVDVSSTVSVSPSPVAPGAQEIPTSAIDLQAVNGGTGSTQSAPIASIPIASIPIASIPIASIPIASIGLTPGLLDIVGGVPLSSIPLSTTGGWDARLVGTPLAGALLNVTTLADVMRQAPGALTGVELGDVGLASSPIASIPIASIALGALHLSDLPLDGNTGAANLDDWCRDLANAGFKCTAGAASGEGTLGDGSSIANATLASIGIEGAPIASIPIASIPIASIPIASIPIASIPIASIPIASIAVAGSPIASIPIASIDVAGSPIASIPIASIPIASIPNIIDPSYTGGGTLGDAAAAGGILPSAKLADLGNAILMSIKLGDLWPYFPDNVTLADLFAAIAGQPQDRGYERLPFTRLPAAEWASMGGKAQYKATFKLDGGPIPGDAAVFVRLPFFWLFDGDATLVHHLPDGSTVTTKVPPTKPRTFRALTTDSVSTLASSRGGLIERFDLTGVYPDDTYDLIVNALPSLNLGAAGQALVGIQPAGATTATTLTAPDVSVADNLEGQTRAITPGTLDFGYMTSATDVDTYTLSAPPAGSHVTVKLVPPTGADYDLALYRPTADALLTATPGAPLDGQAVPDQGVDVTHSYDTQAPETLADVPIASIPLSSVSDNRGDAEEETTALVRSSDQGKDLTIRVSGYQGATSRQPYTLLVTVTPPIDLTTCAPSPIQSASASPLGALPSPGSTPANLNSLFIVDSARLSAAYGPAAAQSVLASLSNLAGRSNLGVVGAVLDVSRDAGVRAAEADWDQHPCLPDKANAVASAIANLAATYRAARPGVKYETLVGGDDQIPFFRLPDLTTVSNETDYASTFLDKPNQYFGSLASGDVMSDNPYGTTSPTPFFDRYLYVPSIALGRLVESPTDITNAVNQFISFSGRLAPSTALVTGYDFLADGSHTVATSQAAERGATNVKTLIDDPGSTSPKWSATSLNTALGSNPATVLSLNAHYDHYRLLPSDQGALFDTSQMTGKNLARKFVFTMGCHAGFSASDIIVGGADSRHLDWAQVYGAGGALFAGNTGFGYGDTSAVAYSEQLMAELSTRLDGTVTAGQALMFAKNAFKQNLGTLDVYDEKVLSETTFYGLPMYQVGTAVTPPAPPAPRPTTAEPSIGANIVSTSIASTPTFIPKTSPFGSYFAGPGTAVLNYRPIEPSMSLDVTEPGLRAHGALITSLSSTDSANGFDPAFAMPTIDKTASSPEPTFKDAVFPTKIQTIQAYVDPNGQRQQLVLITGQFASNPAATDGTGRQRKFTQIGTRVYYAPTSQIDFKAAEFGLVQGFTIGGNWVSFSVHANDGLGTGVKRVLVAYHDGSTWKFVDLAASGGDLWTGGGPTTTPNPEFFVQAVDGAGNVSVTSYKGRYYLAPPAPASPTNGFEWTLAGTLGDNGWYTSAVVATVTPDDAQLNVDGGEATSSPVTIDGSGVHLLAISDGGTPVNVPVPIDKTPPTIAVSPGDGAIYDPAAVLHFACSDVGSGVASCTATVNGNPASDGDSLLSPIGPKTVVVTAKDRAGNTNSRTVVVQNFWPFQGFFSPIVNPPKVNFVNPGNSVPIKFSLGGDRGLSIFATNSPYSEPGGCNGAPINSKTVEYPGASTLMYDSRLNQYQFNWKTSKDYRGCRTLFVVLADGSVHTALFNFG